MTFTDADLKRLKERVDASARHVDPYCPSVDLCELRSLLARLEAAEEVCLTDPQNILGYLLAKRAWRKAKGDVI